MGAGWAYWEFKPFHDITTTAGNRSEGFFRTDGSTQTSKVKALSRTYIKAAQGTIENMSFVHAGANATQFAADIKVDMSIKEPTEIHVLIEGIDDPWYPNGVIATAKSQTDPQPKTVIK